jgi:pilus assembly protein CpaE
MTNLAFDTTGDQNGAGLRPSAHVHSLGQQPRLLKPVTNEPSDAILKAADIITDPQQAQICTRKEIRVPRITVHAFSESSNVANAFEGAAKDRLMSRAHVIVHAGGIDAAIHLYREAPTPDLIVVESCSANEAFLAHLDCLAEVCDAGTKLMVVGHANDINFYRELTRRGVSEYMIAPIDPVSFVNGISSIYRETGSGKLGQIYAFIGAKGGVGSSTVAHNVGWAMARHFGSEVVLADMDLPFGTASLNFNQDALQGVMDAVRDASRLDEVLLDRLLTRCGDHLSLLAAPTELETPYDLAERAIEPLLEVAQTSVPFMILDMPHLWTSWVRSTLVSADEVVITAMPDLANLRNAKNVIDFLRRARPNDAPPKLILNQVGMPKRPEIKPEEFVKALQMDATTCIPFEPHLFGTAANSGQMIAEVSAKAVANKAFAEVAEVLTGRKETKRRRGRLFGLRSLLGRLAGQA